MSEDEATRLAINGLPVSPNVYANDPVFRRIGDQIAGRGIEVEYVDFAISGHSAAHSVAVPSRFGPRKTPAFRILEVWATGYPCRKHPTFLPS